MTGTNMPALPFDTSAAAAQPAVAPHPYVLLEDTGVNYIAQPGHQAFYDDAAGFIHVVEGRMVSTVALPTLPSGVLSKDDSTPSRAGMGDDDHPTGSGTPALHTPRTAASTPAVSPQKPYPNSSNSIAPATVSAGGSAGQAVNTQTLHRRGFSDVSSIASDVSATARAFLVSEGPPVTAIRTSLDGAFTALQRSTLQVEFIEHSTGNMFVEVPQKKDAELHGFFWTDAPEAQFVLVTSEGLEFSCTRSGQQGLRPTSIQRLSSVQWFLWSHTTRILICGCGSSGAKLQPFQISQTQGIVRLPLLDLTPPWGSPVKKKAPSSSAAPTGASQAAPWLLVTPAQVWVLFLYRRIFVAYYNPVESVLKLYRLYRDATALFAECSLQTKEQIELSVVDDVIVVHDLALGVASVLDIAANSAIAATTLQSSASSFLSSTSFLGATGSYYFYGSGSAGSGSAHNGPKMLHPLCESSRLGVINDLKVQQQLNVVPVPARNSADQGLESSESPPHVQRLTLYHPDYALDTNLGHLLKLRFDLVALSEARQCSTPSLLSFLRRRKWRATAEPRGDPRYVILRVLRRLVSQRAAPAELRAAFDAVLSSPGDPRRSLTASAPTTQRKQPLKEEEIHKSVHAKEIALGILAPLLQAPSPASLPAEDKETSPPSSAPPPVGSSTATTDPHLQSCLYLQAALAELLSSCYSTGNLPIDADVADLYLTSYCAAGKEAVLPQLLQTHAALLDSAEMAERLTAGAVGGAGHSCSDALMQALTVQMWKRLGNHATECRELLQRGKVAEAIKQAQKYGLVVPCRDKDQSSSSGSEMLLSLEECRNAAELHFNENKLVALAVQRLCDDYSKSSSSSTLEAHGGDCQAQSGGGYSPTVAALQGEASRLANSIIQGLGAFTSRSSLGGGTASRLSGGPAADDVSEEEV